MTTLNEKSYLSDLLKWEQEHRYSRELGIILAESPALEIGSVLGKITASGKYQLLDTEAVNGAEDAAAIFINPKPVDVSGTGSADATDVLVLTDGPAIVNENALVWPAGISEGDKAAAIAQLKELGIKVYKGA